MQMKLLSWKHGYTSVEVNKGSTIPKMKLIAHNTKSTLNTKQYAATRHTGFMHFVLII